MIATCILERKGIIYCELPVFPALYFDRNTITACYQTQSPYFSVVATGWPGHPQRHEQECGQWSEWNEQNEQGVQSIDDQEWKRYGMGGGGTVVDLSY